MNHFPSSPRTTIIVAAGGTGGHVFPAFALMEELYKQNYRVIIVTDERGNRFLPELSHDCLYEKFLIQVSNIRSGSILQRVKAGWSLVKSIGQVVKLIEKTNAQALVGFGGYPAFPAMLASVLTRKPLIIHEQNAILGRTNRFMARFAQLIATSFHETQGIDIRQQNCHVTGNPVRKDIRNYGDLPLNLPDFHAGQKLKILTMGGSQGAQIMGEIVPHAIGLLPAEKRKHLSIIQQVRQEQIEAVRELYDTLGVEADIRAFIDDIGKELAQSHLVISRSGATSIAELTLLGRSAIFVPLPSAMDDQQTINAEALVAQHASLLIKQSDFTPERLSTLLSDFLADPSLLLQKGKQMQQMGFPNAASDLAKLVTDIVI